MYGTMARGRREDHETLRHTYRFGLFAALQAVKVDACRVRGGHFLGRVTLRMASSVFVSRVRQCVVRRGGGGMGFVTTLRIKKQAYSKRPVANDEEVEYAAECPCIDRDVLKVLVACSDVHLGCHHVLQGNVESRVSRLCLVSSQLTSLDSLLRGWEAAAHTTVPMRSVPVGLLWMPTRASPKSAILGVPAAVIRMFSGLRSLCGSWNRWSVSSVGTSRQKPRTR
jgi:hypothetical protein